MTLCSRETFALVYGTREPHPSCFANLVTALEPYDIQADAIPTTFDVFINVDVAADGTFRVLPPRSKAGARIELRAAMDLVVGLTACSAEQSNNYRFKLSRGPCARSCPV